MKIVYFDCFAGISGDMILGAFLDAGIDEDFLKKELDKLNVPGFHLEVEKTKKRSISGTQCKVIMETHEHPHRHLKDIKEIFEASDLNEEIVKTAMSIFYRIARAEADVHGTTEDKIHFHEVGAVDSIVDITGAAICLHHIAADKIFGSAVNAGKGWVKCAHGTLPVPTPAVLEIAADSGFPLYSEKVQGESATPTGLAILSEVAEFTPEVPKMVVDRIGYGFGEREFEILNGLRVIIGHVEPVKKTL